MNNLYLLLKILWNRVRFRYNYWILSDSDGKVSFAVIGNATGRNPYCRTYLEQRDTPKVLTKWYMGSEKIANKLVKKYGLVVLADVSLPSEFTDRGLCVPNFISPAIQLPADLPTYLKSISASMRSNIRLLEKKHFTWRISKEPTWVTRYYRHYYRPTMLQSHGDEAYIYSESALVNMVHEPGMEFLLISENEEIVGAALCQIKNETYHIKNLGWLNGNNELKKKGVPSAFFWYAICHSFQIGCKLVNCGGSPPYLENGVTRFKMPWGATYCRELTQYGERTLLLNPNEHHCYKFLSHNSIVAYGIDKELIVLSNKRPEEINLRNPFLKDIKAWYLLRSQESNDWKQNSHCHLPLSLRNWYEYIQPLNCPKNPKLADSKPAVFHSALAEN